MSETRGSSVEARHAIDNPKLLDPAQFAEHVRPHMAALTRLAARIGPAGMQDDVVQEALIRAWRHRSRYSAARGPFVNWLLAIVANEARRASGRVTFPLRVDRGQLAADVDQRVDVEAAVRRLPARQRLAVDCFYFCGLSVEQTAAVMACSAGTVKSTLADARSTLRNLLEPL